MNTIGSIIVALTVVVSFNTCNFKSDNKSENDLDTTTQFYIMGSFLGINEKVKLIVEKSGIRKGGFVLVISPLSHTNNLHVNQLRNAFYHHQIQAIHNIVLSGDSMLTKTDIIMIKHASIICIISSNYNNFMTIADNSFLVEALNKSIENGSSICGIGSSALIIGEYYYDMLYNNNTNKAELILKPGLGLLAKTVIIKNEFVDNYRTKIAKDIADRQLSLITIDDSSNIWLNNTDTLDLVNAK